VLNANYIKERLKGDYHLPYDRTCMHECVFTDKHQQEHHVATLDIAKRLMDHGFHPPTIYFPLVVSGAIMIEPTESESKETLDQFIDAMKQIAQEAVDCAPTACTNRPSSPKSDGWTKQRRQGIHVCRDRIWRIADGLSPCPAKAGGQPVAGNAFLHRVAWNGRHGG
jgi:glycine cleavage system protein P-like pyridoxal-binding family